MKKYTLTNGIRVIYEYRDSNITSFCIGFNAGALVENKNQIGLAHITEHMLFKGTNKRNEFQINRALDETFGFNNAMTNFPYCIYYGTTLSEDFERGFEIYANIVTKPSLSGEGFREEIDVICEELKEWKEDNYQLCEDELLKNAFNNRRIKTCIIGEEENLRNFSINDIRSFYESFYYTNNCVISVVTGLKEELVLDVIEKYMNCLQYREKREYSIDYEKQNSGVFNKYKEGMEGAKIQYGFPTQQLSNKEVNALRLFNFKFGEGTSSILYDEIRTKNGLAYEVSSSIKNESGIKLFTISMGTSTKNIDRAIELINNKINNLAAYENYFNKNDIVKIAKSLSLKRELSIEKSIELCKQLTTNEIMYEDFDIFKALNGIEEISKDEIFITADKVLNKPAIQILSNSN